MCGGSVVEDVQTAVQAPIEVQESFVSSLDPNAGSVLNSYDNSAFSPLSSVGVLTGEVTSDTQYRDDTVTAAPYVAAGTAAVAGGYALAGSGSGAAAGSLAEGSYVAPTGTLGSGAFDYGAFAATAEAPVEYGLGGEALYYGGVGAANGAATNAAAGAATGGSSWWQAPLTGIVTSVGTQAAMQALSPKPSSSTPQSVATARQPTAAAPPVVNVGSSNPGKVADNLLNNPTAIGAVLLGIAVVGASMKKARR